MIGVANLCYYLGPLSERLVRTANVAAYRKIVFWLGFWFSVLLPFAPSVFLFPGDGYSQHLVRIPHCHGRLRDD